MDAAFETGRACSPVCFVLLRLAEGHADRFDAVAFCGQVHQRSPTGADVEEPHPGCEPELATDELELGFLGVVEPAGRILHRRAIREIGARVGQAAIEPQGIEGVADVVVEADGGHVAGARVTPAMGPAHPAKWSRAWRTAPQLEAPPCDAAEVAGIEPAQVEHPTCLDDGADIAGDVEVATQVALRETVLGWRHEQASQGVRSADDHGGAGSRGGEPAAVANLAPGSTRAARCRSNTVVEFDPKSRGFRDGGANGGHDTPRQLRPAYFRS